MRKYIAELTEKTAEIKSSDGNQLGVVFNIAGNRIVMHVYVGRKGKFVIPEKMIDKIRKGVIYLTLSKREFEAWWVKEGQKLKREYEKDLDIALGKILVGEDLQLLRENIGRAFQSNFDRSIPKDHRQRLCSDQEDIRISLPAHIRNDLDSDEWVYHSENISHDEDLLFVTSRRLIRLKSGWGKKHNWEIPIEKIESVSLFGKVDPDREHQIFGTRFGTYSVLRIKYKTNRHSGFKEVWIHVGESWVPEVKRHAEQLVSIKEHLEKAIDISRSGPATLETILEFVCSYCGHESSYGAKFCVNCGRHLE